MIPFFYDLPTWLAAILFAAGSVGVGLGGMFLLRPLFHRLIHSQDKLNEMVSLNIASYSLFYGIMLGLVAVGVYTSYASTMDVVEREASTVAALYSDTSALPEPSRTQLLADLRAYAKETIEKDWPTQGQGLVPTRGTDLINAYRAHLFATHPTEKADQIAYAAAFGQLEKLVELRSSRLARVTSGTPPALWWVIAVGALLSIGIIWMLDMEVHVHSILTAVLSLFLGIVFFVIIDMDKPYRGDVFVGPDPYELVYADLMKTPEAKAEQAKVDAEAKAGLESGEAKANP